MKRTKHAASSVTYILFRYRQELRRPRNLLALSEAKLHLTEKLITGQAKELPLCSVNELKHLSREVLFKKKLKRHIRLIRKCRKLGIPHRPYRGCGCPGITTIT